MLSRTWVLTLAIPCATVLAENSSAPLPRWGEETKTWLARAMVAEAGWEAERDHVAIAYVLLRKWRTIKRSSPDVRLIHIIRGYCAGLEPGRRELTNRQRWLRSLSMDMLEPDGWPKSRARWSAHKKLWAAALKRAELVYRGELRDPCRGKAWHWGGAMDPRKGKMYVVDCGETLNTFYGIRQGGDNGKEENTDEETGPSDHQSIAGAVGRRSRF